MKYVLIILLFLEVVFGAAIFAPVFADKPDNRDSLSLSNLDMTMLSPEEAETRRKTNRTYRILFKSAATILLGLNTAGLVVFVRKFKHL